MTISYIARRVGQKEFDQTILMWNWCQKNFGSETYKMDKWSAGFADQTDEWIKFTFYDEGIAAWFILMFPDVMSEEQFEWRHFQRI